MSYTLAVLLSIRACSARGLKAKFRIKVGVDRDGYGSEQFGSPLRFRCQSAPNRRLVQQTGWSARLIFKTKQSQPEPSKPFMSRLALWHKMCSRKSFLVKSGDEDSRKCGSSFPVTGTLEWKL